MSFHLWTCLILNSHFPNLFLNFILSLQFWNLWKSSEYFEISIFESLSHWTCKFTFVWFYWRQFNLIFGVYDGVRGWNQKFFQQLFVDFKLFLLLLNKNILHHFTMFYFIFFMSQLNFWAFIQIVTINLIALSKLMSQIWWIVIPLYMRYWINYSVCVTLKLDSLKSKEKFLWIPFWAWSSMWSLFFVALICL